MKPQVSPLAQGPALHATNARPRWQLTLPGVPGACATWQRLDLAAHAGLAFGPRVIAGSFGSGARQTRAQDRLAVQHRDCTATRHAVGLHLTAILAMADRCRRRMLRPDCRGPFCYDLVSHSALLPAAQPPKPSPLKV